MTVAVFRFYEELNDFVAPSRRQHEFEFRCARAATVKNAIEAIGVPHSEVELIIANGESVNFSYRVRDGDRISVYPMFESFDVQLLLRVRTQPCACRASSPTRTSAGSRACSARAVAGLPAEALSFAALALVANEVHIVGSAVGTRAHVCAALAMAAAGQIRCHTETQQLNESTTCSSRWRKGASAVAWCCQCPD